MSAFSEFPARLSCFNIKRELSDNEQLVRIRSSEFPRGVVRGKPPAEEDLSGDDGGDAGGKYITEAGEERSYTAYVCPGYIAGICPNSKRVPEEWLREVVVAKIRERLFPWTE